MAKMYLAFGLITLVLCIFCVVQIIQTKEGEARHLHKLVWLVLVLLFPFVGSIAWLAVGSPYRGRPRPQSTPRFPEYDRPGRAVGPTPESDEEFLKRVRERAEEQRRRAAEEQKRRDEAGD